MHEEILACSEEHPADIPQADLDEMNEMLRDAHERDEAEQSEQKRNAQIVTPDRNSSTTNGFGQLPAAEFDVEYLRLIKLDLENAQAHRHEMPDEAKRGLLDETLDFFNVGYLPDWILTKSRAEFNCGIYVDKKTGKVKHLPPSSERVIVPTASGNHFNAVATPAARRKMKKDFWKQHAGDMELFGDPDALKADTILIVEGEFDAMTIWQASQGKIPVVAILGAANWKATLLPKLDDIRIWLKKPQIDISGLRLKRLILMLDADDSGQKNSKLLLNELLKRGYPTVYRTLYDALIRHGEELYKQDKKVDANQVYCDFKYKDDKCDAANRYLETLIQKMIIDDAKDELDRLEAGIKQGKYAVEDKPRNTEFSAVTGADVDEIKLILKDFVHAKDLSRDEWWAVGSIMFRYGFKLEDFHKWSNDGDSRYNESSCDTTWNGYKTAQELQDDDATGYTIGTLIQLAKEKGYVPPHKKPTTKDKIADCPVELILPPDVLFSYSGITLKESRGEDKPPRYLTAATTPIVPTKIFRDENSGLVQYELAILTQGKWRRHVVDGRTIQSPRCVDKLANFGALIKPSPLCEYFTRIIAANSDRLKTWRVFAQPGWYGEKFQHFIYPTGGETYIVDRAGYNYKADYAERGNADEWRQVFCEAIKAGGRIARVFVGVAVAAPLIRPLKITNLQAHLFGGVNAGKTVLVRLTASIWGNPQELLRTFESSPKRRQADAAANNDLPTFYDELETVRGQRAEMSLTQSVYAFFNGKGNQNLNVDGTARDTFKFTGSRLSTGERQILKVADQFGAYKRLVPLECKGKIFDKQLATRLYRFTGDNFGHFGRGWTTYISEHLTAIREKYEAKERDLLTDETHEETQLRTICAACVAYQFFAQYLDLQDGFDEHTFLDDATETIDELPTVEESSDSARALDVLKDIVASNEDRFYMETLSTNTPRYHEVEPKANGEHWGKLYLDGAVAIYPTTLSDILVKKGFASPEMLIRTWNDEGKLIANEGRNTRQMRIGDTRQRTVYFKAGILSESRDDKALNDDAPPT